jgi:hypothetical protein
MDYFLNRRKPLMEDVRCIFKGWELETYKEDDDPIFKNYRYFEKAYSTKDGGEHAIYFTSKIIRGKERLTCFWAWGANMAYAAMFDHVLENYGYTSHM